METTNEQARVSLKATVLSFFLYFAKLMPW